MKKQSRKSSFPLSVSLLSFIMSMSLSSTSISIMISTTLKYGTVETRYLQAVSAFAIARNDLGRPTSSAFSARQRQYFYSSSSPSSSSRNGGPSINKHNIRRPFSVLRAASDSTGSHPTSSPDNNDNDSGERFEPTYTYEPYDPKVTSSSTLTNTRRRFSTWTVPKSITIPEDQIEINFVRSSGAGGQNVNKVNTKVELRLHVMDSEWIGPEEVRQRLKEQQESRINKNGYLTITSQEHRTQVQNRKNALSKLEQMILEAWSRPKIRKQRTGISKASKERNKEFKRKRAEVKQNRRSVDW